MLALLLALSAHAGVEDDFYCAEAHFTVASSIAALATGEADEEQTSALRLARDRAAQVVARCPGFEVPPACAEPTAAAALTEAVARIERRDAAKALADSRPLATLGSELEGFATLISRIDAVLAESDRNLADVEDLRAKRAQAVEDSEARREAIAARHLAEAAFADKDEAWLEAAAALNGRRCEIAVCTLEATGVVDPACPGKAHPPTDKTVERLREVHAATAAALARFPETQTLDAIRARLSAQGAEGPRPAYLQQRTIHAWRKVVDSALRPYSEHQRIGSVLAQIDGLQRMSPATMRWVRLAITWRGGWERSMDKVDGDIDELAAAWANADAATGGRSRDGAQERITRAEGSFREHQPAGLASPPRGN